MGFTPPHTIISAIRDALQAAHDFAHLTAPKPAKRAELLAKLVAAQHALESIAPPPTE